MILKRKEGKYLLCKSDAFINMYDLVSPLATASETIQKKLLFVFIAGNNGSIVCEWKPANIRLCWSHGNKPNGCFF